MSIQAVAKGSGYYRVHVKDAGGTWQKYTRHTQVHKAIQVASELIEGGEPIVLVDHDFNLEITDSNAQHTPNLPSDDDLASDITSIVAAGRSLDGTTTKLYVRGMGIEEVIIAPQSPWQNPYAERLIGSIRRECLDHVIVLSDNHLRRVLRSYLDYYHDWRTHLSLDMDCPEPREVQGAEAGEVVEVPEVGGLHHHYEPRAA